MYAVLPCGKRIFELASASGYISGSRYTLPIWCDIRFVTVEICLAQLKQDHIYSF